MTIFRAAPVSGGPPTPADQYDAVAEASSALVIGHYSSSFGLASRLLHRRVRSRVTNIYALARVADEIVDAPRQGEQRADRQRLLDALHVDLSEALRTGHSPNLVVHAFARTAQECGFGGDLVDPFFASMRADLGVVRHDPVSFARYVYGSAEVVGLMCLRAFVADERDPDATYDALADGARRLGAAFQKINFVRDLAEDSGDLGRCYFPGIDPSALTDAQRDVLLDDIEDDLRASEPALERLPTSSRRAVRAAHDLFAALAVELRTVPAARIRSERIRLEGRRKLGVLVRSLSGPSRRRVGSMTGLAR